MLTISQLASYAGVTVRTVRHYHAVGLLPEPERDRSGYRRYDAAAVVALIKIRTLAEAGVPLSRVQELLDADASEFAAAVDDIDRRLRAEVRALQRHRTQIARLAAGDSLALPPTVVGYLDRLRDLGVAEHYVAMERDAWIVVAAQVPEHLEGIIAKKHTELDDPEMVRLYLLLSEAIDWSPDDPRIVEIVDILEQQMLRALASGGDLDPGVDDQAVTLLDDATVTSAPAAGRMLELLHERGWRGWTRIERTSPAETRSLDHGG